MKKLAKLFLVLTMVITTLPTFVLAEAQPGVVFYNAAGAVITSLDEVSEIYAEVNFDSATSATVIGAHYNFDGKLEKTEFITPVNEVSGYTTPSFSVENTDVVKIFAWSDFVTLTPVLNPGVIYKTPELPTATVTTLNTAEIEDVDLTFAMNFKADEVNQYQLATYGNWYADYVLTVNKTVSYNANGTADAYLAGQYDSWSKNWLAVPTSTYTVEANTPVKVMESAAAIYGKPGLKYTYKEVYESVKDFDCGVFFDDEFLAANPDLTATLELRMYNPENESESYNIGETYTFTAMEAIYGAPLPTATVTMLDTDEIADVDLTFAMNFKADEVNQYQLATYGNWYADYVLTVNKTVSYNANGTADAYLAGQYDSWSKNWLAVPTSTYTVEANTPVKVMESAAAIYGKPGLKYTYKEVYESVKDFDCGVFFGDEFLSANPDLTATLELRMYNPENESESYVIGETYTFKTTGAGTEAGVDTVLTSGNVTAEISANVVLESGVENLKLTTTSLSNSESGITADENEKLTSFDVHVEGVAKNNTTPVIITIPEAADKGLNKGNLELYHVENGETVMMEEVESKDDLTKHNQFTYEPLDGTVVLALASFSEIALLSNTKNAWNGEYDYSWYNAKARTVEEYIIANADQLAGFSAIVGGMAEGVAQDSFEGKTVKLNADINIGDTSDANDIVFYPIGYYNTEGTYEKTGTAITSGFYTFNGTFDGNGHTIANFYQNTWEMKGDNEYYPATEQRFRDGMGLFGKLSGATVKNLTVDNFSSDGEYTTTGVIAAYADSTADKSVTFANIAIKNCNPRVYNIGNGGIVGSGGWYSRNNENVKPIIFENITVDNTNTISSLWGSWDTGCGGIMGRYYPQSKCGVTFKNCHVAAQIDVYNDVCGNYQYYWYRYAGMMIGTVEESTTDTNGYTIPDTSTVKAEGCTVHFGEWNDYYYCELVANSLASYTHDHQFSRLEEIKSLDEINDGENWTKAGNFLLISGDTKTCYHIVNKNGVLTQHNHADAGTETVDGVEVLKEDNQIVYLPFNQLFQGNGWGVKHIPVYNGENYAFKGITILDREVADSVEKFVSIAKDSYETDTPTAIGELFKTANSKVEIKSDKVQVFVSPIGEDSTVSAAYAANTTDWTQGTLTFSGTGAATVTITDYYYCTPTTITVTIKEHQPVKKFELVFENTGKYMYRVGNGDEIDNVIKSSITGVTDASIASAKAEASIKLGSLFKEKEDVKIGSVSVDVETVSSNVTYTYTPNNTWANSTINFDGTGVVKVTIKDDDSLCIPTELYLEVVDAMNATGAVNAPRVTEFKDKDNKVVATASSNVVLLNDCGFSSLTVSGGYTLYGNGFAMTCASDSYATNMGYSFVTLENGTLDNVQIICPDFSYAILYDSNKKDSGNASHTDANGTTRYYNIRSAVKTSGNNTIVNSYISGGRSSVYVTSGKTVLDNTTVRGGAVSNIQVNSSAGELVLRDATLIQKPIKATVNDTSKTLMGFSVMMMCDSNGNAAPITVEGELVQYAWADASDAQYVPSKGQSVVEAALKQTNYMHDINGDGTNESVNLGVVYFPESTTVGSSTVTDSRTNADDVPYETVGITAKIDMADITVPVWTYKNTNGTADAFRKEPVFVPNAYDAVAPVITFADENAERKMSKEYDVDKGWVNKLTVLLDAGSYNFSFADLKVHKDGLDKDYTVYDAAGNLVDTTSDILLDAIGTKTYTLKTTVDSVEYTLNFTIVSTRKTIPVPVWITKPNTATGGVPVGNSKDSDWSAAAAVLNGTIRYWSVRHGKTVDLDISTLTPKTTKGKLNDTANNWSYTDPNGDFTLKLTGAVIHDSSQTQTMPVCIQEGNTYTLYFVCASDRGFVQKGTTTREVKITYEFTDGNGKKLVETGPYTWTVSNDGAEKDYNSFCNGTMKDASCITPETLITLADGSQVEVQYLTGDEELLVWNMETGSYDKANIVFIDSDDTAEYDVVTLVFSDGTETELIYEHGYFDVTLGKYVYIDKYNAESYIGHNFVKQADIEAGTWDVVTLESVSAEVRETKAYSPVTFSNLCYYVDGMLSMPGGIDGLFNIFEVDTDIMAYDAEKMAQDIETYGLYTYADFEDLIPEYAYEAFNGDILKVAIGKGMLTWADIEYLANRYGPLFNK